MKLVPCVFALGGLAALAPLGEAQCQFNQFSVANATAKAGTSVGLDGNLVAIGAPEFDGVGANSGAVYVFFYSGLKTTPLKTITPSSPAAGDKFGGSVAVSGDKIIVGALANDAQGNNAGRAYIYRKVGSQFIEEAILSPNDPGATKLFGEAVDIEGNLAIVGASGDDQGGNNVGAAYIFRFDGVNWNQEAKLVPTGGTANGRGGRSVSVSGTSAVVGAPGTTFVKGRAFGFEFASGVWSQLAELDPGMGALGIKNGTSVSIDGTAAATGDIDSQNGKGVVYIFRKTGGTYVLEATLLPTPLVEGDEYGNSVSLDGNRVLIGGPQADSGGVDTGGAALFEFDGINWNQIALIPGPGARFGNAVALDGQWLLVGNPIDDGAANDAGTAFLYNLPQCPLVADVPSISISTGGVQTLTQNIGTGFAGDFGLLVGSASGTSPGFGLGGHFVPLNSDFFTTFTLQSANQPPFGNSFGGLDAMGKIVATITVPPGQSVNLLSVTLNHAFAVVRVAGSISISFVSNPVALSFVP